MKFNLQKPVRVCQLCNDVLTLGVMAARWFDWLYLPGVQLYAFRYVEVRSPTEFDQILSILP